MSGKRKDHAAAVTEAEAALSKAKETGKGWIGAVKALQQARREQAQHHLAEAEKSAQQAAEARAKAEAALAQAQQAEVHTQQAQDAAQAEAERHTESTDPVQVWEGSPDALEAALDRGEIAVDLDAARAVLSEWRAHTVKEANQGRRVYVVRCKTGVLFYALETGKLLHSHILRYEHVEDGVLPFELRHRPLNTQVTARRLRAAV